MQKNSNDINPAVKGGDFFILVWFYFYQNIAEI